MAHRRGKTGLFVFMDEALLERIRRRAYVERMSMSEWVRQNLRTSLRVRRQKPTSDVTK